MYLIVILAFCYQVITYSIFTVDDAFITWRYGKNLVEAGTWNYNPSSFELVEAYTNPLFAFLSIIPHLLHLDVVLFFKIFMLSVHAIYLCRTYAILGTIFCIPAVILLITPSFVLHNYSGLETTFFGLMVFELFYQATRRDDKKTALVSLLLVFTRPEGVLFSLCVVGYALICRNLRLFLFALAPIGIFLAYVAFRMDYFGIPLPNTFYIKSKTEFSFPVFKQMLFCVLPLIPAMIFLKPKERCLLAAFSASLILIAFTYSTSALTMNYLERFAWHLLLPSFMISLLAISRHSVETRKSVSFFVCFIVLFAAFVGQIYYSDPTSQAKQIDSLTVYYPRLLKSHADLGRLLREIKSRDTIFSFGDAGITAYHSGLNAIDNIGLANRTVARKEFDVSYLERVRPKIIVFYAVADGKILERDHNQAALVKYVQNEKLEHICDAYYTSNYTLAIYAELSVIGDLKQNFLDLCRRSRLANDAPDSALISALSGYRFFDFWFSSVPEFQGAAKPTLSSPLAS